jgi:uncharacterized protein GlcG (DUF336 family)
MATQRYRSIWVITLVCSVFLTAIFLWGNGSSRASGPPKIDREKTILLGSKKKGFQLEVVGENFQPGATIVMETSKGNLASAAIKYVDETKLVVENVTKQDFKDGVATIEVRNPDGTSAKETLAVIPSAIGPSSLTVADIQQIIAQGAAAALKLNLPGTMCVMDREGNILALFQMTGAPKTVVVQDLGTLGQGLEGLGGTVLPGAVKSEIAAISKAGVGAFFGTQGNAFSTRTAAYIIREHIPPFIKNMPGGPLFGVQVSSLGCSDVKQPGLPLGLAGDTGGFPIYKNGIMAGGFSFEGNGQYTVALNRPGDLAYTKGNKDKKVVTPNLDFYMRDGIEEQIAGEALKGFDAPDFITGDKILVNGIRLPYTLEYPPVNAPAIAFRSIPGKLLPIPETGQAEIRSGVRTEFRDILLRDRPVRVVNRFFPFKKSPNGPLSAADAEQILFQAVAEANRTRAAIRRPIEVPVEINLAAVDQDGVVLGLASTPDAPVFGFDVCVEKARAGIFFSRPDALSRLRSIGLGKYATRFEQEAFPIGSFFLTSRSVGWIHRPFYPDGIEDRQEAGPPILSTPPADFSPINNGFQTDYLLTGTRSGNPLSFVIGRSIVNVTLGKRGTAADFFCDASNGKTGSVLNNTLMIFSGSCGLFRGGVFAGNVGGSGDGIDQDNIIVAYGAVGFEVPDDKRADRIFYRGIRVPYNKFPRHPHLGEEGDN